jgi:hypothetical protein
MSSAVPLTVEFGERVTRDSPEVRHLLDSQGQPVRDRLATWPATPDGERGKVKRRRFATGLAGFVLEAIVPQPKLKESDQLPDAPHETDRLVVLVGDPGSIAAGAPWQLDPSIRPRGTTVVATAENGALMLSVIAKDTAVSSWRVPAEQIRSAERRDHGTDQPGIRVTFTDGSWIRLDSSLWQYLIDLSEVLG